jgi:hypothetical protein
MRITKRQLRKIIQEEVGILDVENLDDIEAIEDVWGGDLEGKDRNLVLPIDHSKAVKSEPVTDYPEMADPAPPVLNKEASNKLQIYRGKNDLGRTYRIPKIVLERYYNKFITGDSAAASVILEEHLDAKCPGWINYEWRN